MSMAVTTSRVPCPMCGEGATLTVNTEFGAGRESSAASLQCGNACRPDETQLGELVKVPAQD